MSENRGTPRKGGFLLVSRLKQPPNGHPQKEKTIKNNHRRGTLIKQPPNGYPQKRHPCQNARSWRAAFTDLSPSFRPTAICRRLRASRFRWIPQGWGVEIGGDTCSRPWTRGGWVFGDWNIYIYIYIVGVDFCVFPNKSEFGGAPPFATWSPGLCIFMGDP